METTTKVLKSEKLTAIRAILVEAGADEMLIEEIDKQLGQIAARAERAAERRAEKKAAGDALCDTIMTVITDEYQTADDVFAALEDVEDITIAKVRSRLTQLAALGKIEKADAKVGEKVKKVYKLA